MENRFEYDCVIALAALLKFFCQFNGRAWLYAARFISVLPAVIVPITSVCYKKLSSDTAAILNMNLSAVLLLCQQLFKQLRESGSTIEDYCPFICFLDCGQVCCCHGKFQGSGVFGKSFVSLSQVLVNKTMTWDFQRWSIWDLASFTIIIPIRKFVLRKDKCFPEFN
ncbi:hypothetical protein NC651_018552 [Populus alba x Populus x berolinensis]|nr:hypothetical protein NC651_018552 [Populus alba x Populus x berolinensis]